MITLNQPGLKSYITYVISFILLSIIIYLVIPFNFKYENSKLLIENKISNNFGLNLILNSEIKYSIFPSPRLKVSNVQVLNLSKSKKKFSKFENIILRIPFKNLISLQTIDFSSIDLINASLNIDASEITSFKKILKNNSYKTPIKFKKGKVNFIENDKLLFTFYIDKLGISGHNFFKRINSKGKIFNTKVNFDYIEQYIKDKPITNFVINAPSLGFKLKFNANSESKKKRGFVKIFFPKNKFYFDYILKNNIINISSTKLQNRLLTGKIFGKLLLDPFFSFDLKFNISSLKFKNIINSDFIRKNSFDKLTTVNKKINGNLKININEIESSSNLINSSNINLEFRNGALIFKNSKLNIKKIGYINFDGKIYQKKKKKIFSYHAKININNSKNFYSRFSIPKKNRIELKPLNVKGQLNLETNEVKIEKIFLKSESLYVEFGENETLLIENYINEVFSGNSLNNIMNYSNFKKIIQSFFILN